MSRGIDKSAPKDAEAAPLLLWVVVRGDSKAFSFRLENLPLALPLPPGFVLLLFQAAFWTQGPTGRTRVRTSQASRLVLAPLSHHVKFIGYNLYNLPGAFAKKMYLVYREEPYLYIITHLKKNNPQRDLPQGGWQVREDVGGPGIRNIQ